ncbi:hypothetical protein [Kitasatospora sp. NBC_01300]|uniref:hypothetical protein n=1 Tax=Kitasatospora sp. NBC_01300 TaxID=2903574 RepID=UPI00352EF50E|nr:hypothetical protein OG556_18350 [Kitasatospora sp. NBC_01300]
MVTRVPEWLLRHRITIEPYLGESAYGPAFGPPVVDVPALVSESVRLVRAPDGRQVVSPAQVLLDLDTTVPAGSRITLPTGRTTVPITVSTIDAPGLPVPAHQEVMCE